MHGYDPLALTDDDPSPDPPTLAQPSHPTPTHHPRPAIYYNDGPFDAPSSDDEAEHLLERQQQAADPAPPGSPGLAESGGLAGSGLVVGAQKRPSHLRCLVIALAALVLLSGAIGMLAATSYQGTYFHLAGVRPLTMDHVFNGTFAAAREALHWVPEAGDGVFSIIQQGDIKLVDLKNNVTRVLVSKHEIVNEHGDELYFSHWRLSADENHILLKADHKKLWRYTSFANYYVHNLDSGITHPLIPPTDPPVTGYAAWSPTGAAIAYVAANDIYIFPSPSPSARPIRVTDTGNWTVFNGLPDWVYEEEVFTSDHTLWWSPDSTKLAFLHIDETRVDTYTYPVYNPSEDNGAVNPYTARVTVKYPKAGYTNPLVSVHTFDLGRHLADADAAGAGEARVSAVEATLALDWAGRHAAADSVILEVAWVGNASLIVKEVNRNADNGSVVLFDLSTADWASHSTGRIVRKLGKAGEEGDDGWIERAQNIKAIPDHLTMAGASAYLDIVPNADGYEHIALFSPSTSATPVFLTSGKWEVTDGIQAVDVVKGVVYFQAARPSSLGRHIFSVPIPALGSTTVVEPTALTDASVRAYHEVQFSPEAGFYLLNYEGPNIPYQKILQVNNTKFEYVMIDNAWLNATWREFEAPVVTYETVDSDGYELNVQEMRPPNMDDTGRTKYPVLFHVYGGPNSQMVDYRFSRDWHDYLACRKEYIVVIVDGRGTGLKGRALRNPVKGNLGFWETRDQVNVARIWAAKNYVDRKRVGIWGWSYGGFMAGKVLEADAGIHSLGMAVAPVTSWQFYDSIYTERYMNLPRLNPGGYVNASIANVTGFTHAHFLLAHGSGDDNVHFANSAHLLDMFTAAHVRDFRFRYFTDSDHSISRRGAYRELHEYMLAFLEEKWGKGARHRGW